MQHVLHEQSRPSERLGKTARPTGATSQKRTRTARANVEGR
jgi:hypothetical protein